jgi:hypothetical protein
MWLRDGAEMFIDMAGSGGIDQGTLIMLAADWQGHWPDSRAKREQIDHILSRIHAGIGNIAIFIGVRMPRK